MLPFLAQQGAAPAVAYVAAAAAFVGIPVSYLVEALARRSRLRRFRLMLYSISGAVAGAIVAAVVFSAPGLVVIAVAVGVYLATGAAAIGPRLRGWMAAVAAGQTVLLALVGIALA